MSRHFGGSGGGSGSSRRPAYQTSSSSSRNYSSTTGTSDRDYSRSHLPGNGSNSASYYSASSASRKPDSGHTTGGYSYLEPNWIEKTRSSIPIDPYASSYLDRAPISTSRDYTTAAAAAAAVQPIYPNSTAAALSVGAYGAASNMPKAYAPRADDYYRAAASAATLATPAAYGYSSAFEQSTMAAQAAAIYEMQNSSKRDAWPAPAASSHVMDYGRRDEERRGGGGMDRRRDDGRREERRVDDRRGVVNESWRDRERDTTRDRDQRRPALPSRERERDRDMRVPASSAPRRDSSHREVRRAEPAPVPPPAARGGRRDEHARDRDAPRDARDASRRSIDSKRAPVGGVDSRHLDRESRDLERQLAKVQRELEQLEGGGRKGGAGGGSSSRDKESDRSRRSAPSRPAASAPRRSAAAPPPTRDLRARPAPPRRTGAPPPARGLTTMTSSTAYTRTFPVRSSTMRLANGRSIGRRPARPSAVLPSLMDTLVPRPGRRTAPVARVSRSSAWEAPVRRGGAPPPPARLPVTRRVVNYATTAGKRTVGGAVTRGVRGAEVALSSREKVRRAKEKMRREEERRKRGNERKRPEKPKESRESRVKRKEEDFAWLETIMSEDEELDEEANRKVLLAPRQRRVTAVVDRAAVHPATAENLQAKMEEGDVDAEPELWTAEEIDAIELLPIVDLSADIGAAFLENHPDSAPKKEDSAHPNGHA